MTMTATQMLCNCTCDAARAALPTSAATGVSDAFGVAIIVFVVLLVVCGIIFLYRRPVTKIRMKTATRSITEVRT